MHVSIVSLPKQFTKFHSLSNKLRVNLNLLSFLNHLNIHFFPFLGTACHMSMLPSFSIFLGGMLLDVCRQWCLKVNFMVPNQMEFPQFIFVNNLSIENWFFPRSFCICARSTSNKKFSFYFQFRLKSVS